MLISLRIMGLIVLVLAFSFSAQAQQKSRNPFLKPNISQPSQSYSEPACDINLIKAIIEEKMKSIAPPPAQDSVAVVNKNLTKSEKILETGAKLVSNVNGIEVYFDDKQGIFIYNDTNKESSNLGLN